MKISLNWLKKYVKIPETVSNEELIRLIGARLVEVEGVIDESKKYNNIVVVKVEKAEKIPETHLTLCQISDGSEELVQVVCGAPNVREGMLAVWIRPGAIVPASVKEDAPFVIGARKMRGYDSNGMLAGADELDFGDDHSGIVEIDPLVAKPGDLLADVFELNDLVLEIENKSLTHRPDCFGIIGFAREVAGILNIKFDEKSFNNNLEVNNNIKINIDKNVCSRYSAVVLEKHGELKKKYLTWEDTMLCKAGMKPISPIVDATNYLMLLTGQPLHAFDYYKFAAVNNGKVEINVRLAKNGEKLVLLDDKEVELNENDIVICSGSTPVALAGAMGGKSTEIDENTKNVILESATFSLYNLRKTQMAHGIFSEAITRFTKGQPAYQTLAVAGECAEILGDGFRVAEVADEYPEKAEDVVVKITTDEINNLLGTEYSEELIVKTLENVGFEIAFVEDLSEATAEKEGASPVTTGASDPCPRQMAIQTPSWRTDIHIKEDIIEEVGRLNGYDNILPTLPMHQTATKNGMLELKREIREKFLGLGANEVLTYSFISEKLLEKAGQDPKNSYKIVNSISPELQYVRQSIVPSLLEKAYLNEKLPVEKFALFEMNKVYSKVWGGEPVPVEMNSLGFVMAERKNAEVAFYKAKLYVSELLKELNVKAEFLPRKCDEEAWQPFEPKQSADIIVNGECIGVVGEFKDSVKHEFKLAPYVAGFEIVNLEAILQNAGEKKVIDFSKKKKGDVTVTTDKSYAGALRELRAEYPEAEITPGAIYQAPGQRTRNLTFHIEY